MTNRGKPFLELHETMGTITAITLWVGVVLDRMSRVRRWLWIYAILIALLLTICSQDKKRSISYTSKSAKK
ncbi:MAG: hypothetical protein HY709_08995 [Candidatus Latescibacteria bacterium]|nr:hypothetical protein [Candidatus Latescibacterota bacterium]